MGKYISPVLPLLVGVAEWALQLFLQAAIFAVVSFYMSDAMHAAGLANAFEAIGLNFKIVLIFYLVSLYGFTSLALQIDIKNKSLWVNLCARTILFLIHEAFIFAIGRTDWSEKAKVAAESLPTVICAILISRLVFSPIYKRIKRSA